ncbi:hypothetical protein VPH35_019029 [Triticum aestivum]|nr:uncharacterized protein LOC123187406 [Triticum aestivum]
MAAPGGPAASPPPPPPPPPPPKSDQAVGDASASPPPPPPAERETAAPAPPPPPPPKPDQAVGDASASPPPPPPAETEMVAPAPPPPPPPKPDQAVGDASVTPPPPPETDTAGQTPPPPPQNKTPAGETVSPPQADTKRQTGTGDVAGMSEKTQAPSQETAAATSAEDHLPAPPPPPPPPEEQKQGGTAKDGKDSATANSPRAEERKPGTSRWTRVRSPVLLLLSLFRLRLGKPSQAIEQPKVEDELAAPAQKEESEGSKRRRHEAEASLSPAGRKEAPPGEPHQTKRRKSLQRTESVRPPEGVVAAAAGEADANRTPMKKKLKNAFVLVKDTLAWYGRHRSPKNAEKPEEDQSAAPKEKGGEAKPSTSSPPEEEAGTKSKQDDKTEETTKTKEPSTAAQEESKEKARRRWERAEVRLEKILEDACSRLTLAEFRKLPNHKEEPHQQCLLTFSVFPLGEQVKKQAVTYWWSTRFNLPSERAGGADGIFSKLSGGGFLEPIKNGSTRVIYGCRVNPLVHWMAKRLAREKECADLDDPGGPAFSQPKSEVLCLTAGNRARMQKLREEDGLRPRTRPKPSQTMAPPPATQAVGAPSQKLQEDNDSQAQLKPSPSKVPPGGLPSQDQQDETKRDDEMLETAILLIEFERKKVILNIDAHVYRLPEPLLTKLADGLEVLQLGRWGNTDDETYMEVEALESLSAIGKLKNLRYLSVRGLSRLTELPSEVRRLRKLAILDVRGCQNLVKLPSSTVKKLVGLTHLDLTECYMLEHIGRGVAALPELRVFKGFVFGVGKRRRDACRLQHLAKLKKLWKLSVNVTTDANVEQDEMKQLAKLAGLLSLTVTWGERPSILLDSSPKIQKQLQDLLDTWTCLRLPPQLDKLDVRCYPEGKLPLATWLNGNKKLKKLYVRGGEVKELDIPGDNVIETLRLRYLKEFELKWTTDLLPKLNGNTIKCVEVVDKDSKVVKAQTKGKGELNEKEGTEKEKLIPIKKRMKIPVCTVDEHGVWVRDLKEEDAGGQTPGKAEGATGVAKAENGVDDAGKAQKEVKKEEKPSNLKGTQGENEQPAPAKEDNGATDEIKKVDGGDKNHEIVNKENDNKREAKDEEHDPMKKGPQVHEPNVDGNKVQASNENEELKEAVEKQVSPTLAVDQTAVPRSEGDIKKGAVTDKTHKDKISETKEERQDEPRDAKGQDEPPSKQDTENIDEPQTEGEDKGKDDEQPADEDGGGGGGDTTTGDASSSQASKPKEETPATVTPATETTASPPALPLATTTAAPAAVDTKEPGKAGQDDGPGTGAAVENN